MDKLFTDHFKQINEHGLSKRLRADLKLLKARFNEGFSLHESAEKGTILVAFIIDVNLPMRPDPAISIWEKEPVFILIDDSHYPYTAPLAYSNRLDFPADKLPHLTPVPAGPACFCLHRGNMDNWFIEHGLVEYALRIRSWLNDAAGDKLIRQEDEFEFTRVSSRYGYLISDERHLLSTLEGYYRAKSEADFAISGVEFTVEPKPGKEKRWLLAINQKHMFSNLSEFASLTESQKNINELSEKMGKPIRHSYGVVVYPSSDKVYTEYFGRIPNTFGEFLKWAEHLQLPLADAMTFITSKGMILWSFVPISLVIRRPQKIINHRSNIEVLNFALAVDGNISDTGEINSSAELYLVDHRNAMTFDYANELSGFRTDGLTERQIALIGCGALGSKLGLHLIRSGLGNIKFIDSDYLSPHNLIRNSLLHDSIGQNKAAELKRIGDEIYSVEDKRGYESFDESIITLLERRGLNGITNTIIVDATASASVLSYMTNYELPKESKYLRCELVDDGMEGLLFVEGAKRNPRVDDLKMALFDSAMDNEKVSKWLQRSAEERKIIGSAKEEIMVGMGCNSDTVRISDDLVSFHASTMSSRLRAASSQNDKIGRIYCSSYDPDSLSSPFSSSMLEFGKVEAQKFNNASTWEVRFKCGIKEQLFQLLEADKPNETGGLLLGRIDYVQKTIYVTRVMDAPIDSKKTPYLFQRGKKGIPEYIRLLGSKTGNIITYVGEWHTHPQGGSQLSGTDKQAVKELREVLDAINYPTFITIVTPNKLHPYAFNVDL